MALNTKINAAARSAGCDAIVDLIDAGTPNGYMEVRSGAPPTHPVDANSGTLLAVITFGATAFGSASTGVATANSTTPETNAPGSGDAGHYRIFDGNDVCVMQGTAGESADTPNLVFADKSIVAGGTVSLTSFTATMPEAGS